MTTEVLKALNNLSKKINNMTRFIDNHFDKRCTENAQSIEDVENAACEIDIAYDERLAAIEDALCELDSKGVL